MESTKAEKIQNTDIVPFKQTKSKKSVTAELPPSDIQWQMQKLEYEACLLDYDVRLAEHLAKSDLIPEHFRNKPANVVAAIQYGRSLSLSVSQSLHSINIIKGKPTLCSAAVMGIVLPHADEPPTVEHEKDQNGNVVAVTTTYHRQGKPFSRRFSLKDAERAQLLVNTGWKHYPENMLELRSGVFAARKGFPDILSGIYSSEEMKDMAELKSGNSGYGGNHRRSGNRLPQEVPTQVNTTTDSGVEEQGEETNEAEEGITEDKNEAQQILLTDEARMMLERCENMVELQEIWETNKHRWKNGLDEKRMKFLTTFKNIKKSSLK